MDSQPKDVSKPTDKGVYHQALEAAKRELASLREERQRLDGRIASLDQTVKGLAAVCEEQKVEIPTGLLSEMASGDVAGLGLTSAIRKIVSSRRTQMTPVEIRDALVESGMDLDRYSNAMVAVHNTLKRLYEQGELARSKDEPTRYLWLNDWHRMGQMFTKTALAIQPTQVPKDFEIK